MSATESVRVDYQQKLEREAAERKLDNERQIAAMQKLNVEKQQASKKRADEQAEKDRKKYLVYSVLAGLFATLQLFGALSGGGVGPLLLGSLAAFGCFTWFKKSQVPSTGNSGHWSEKS